MRKTELLKIIKEEIEIALGEGPAEDRAARDAQEKALKAQMKAIQTKLATLAQGGSVNEDEQLDEMAKITEPIQKAIDMGIARVKEKYPEATPKDISNIILSKKRGPEFAPELIKALEDDFQINGGDDNYKYGIQGPQTIRAIEKSLNLSTPGLRGRKPNPDKSTPSKKEKSTKVEKPTTVDKSDDLFDDEGNKIEVDKTIKVATGDKEIEAKLKDVISKKKAKLASGENYDKEVAALKQFLSKPEISKYIKKKTVGGVNPYSIDAILADVK